MGITGPWPSTPNPLCPLLSSHPRAQAAGALGSPPPLPRTPLFCSLPASTPGSLSSLPLTLAPARELLYLWVHRSSVPASAHRGAPASTRAIAAASRPSDPAPSKLQITATPFLKRPALSLDSVIASLPGVNFNPLLPFHRTPPTHTHTHIPTPTPPDRPLGPWPSSCLRSHPQRAPWPTRVGDRPEEGRDLQEEAREAG